MPTDGANRNAQSTPATAGATAYGQIRKRLVGERSAQHAIGHRRERGEIAMPTVATRTLNSAVIWNESR